MPSRLNRNAHFLRLLSSSKPSVKKKLVEHATKDQVDTLSELALNVLNGVIPLESRQFNKLKRHAHKLRTLARKRGSVKRRKQLLVRNQRCGFLPLLAALAPIALNLIIKLFLAKRGY